MTDAKTPRNSLSFTAETAEKPNIAVSLTLALLMLVGGCGAMVGALELDASALVYALLPGVAVIALQFALSRHKIAHISLNIALVLLVIVLTFAVCGGVDSFRWLANRTFETSEKYQSYLYIRFGYASNAADPALALAVLSVVVAALASLAAQRLRRTLPVAMLALFVGAQVYFGVFAPAAWQLVFCLAAVLTALSDRRGGATTLAGAAALLAVVAVAAVLLYPGRSASMHDFSEQLRDRFDDKVERRVDALLNDPQTPPPPVPTDLVSTDDGNVKLDRHESFSGSTIGAARAFHPSVIVVALVAVGIVAAVCWPVVRAMLRDRRRRAAFRSTNAAVALDAMFCYALGRLGAVGLHLRNLPPSGYSDEVAALTSSDYRERFDAAAALRSEALYSDHALDDNQRAVMNDFLDKTNDEVYKLAKFGTKLALKLGLAGGVSR